MGWHFRISISRVERNFLSRKISYRENAAVLRGTILHHRNQLHFLSNPEQQNHRGLGQLDSGTFSFWSQSAAEDHPYLKAPELRGTIGCLPACCFRIGFETGTGL